MKLANEHKATILELLLALKNNPMLKGSGCGLTYDDKGLPIEKRKEKHYELKCEPSIKGKLYPHQN